MLEVNHEKMQQSEDIPVTVTRDRQPASVYVDFSQTLTR